MAEYSCDATASESWPAEFDAWWTDSWRYSEEGGLPSVIGGAVAASAGGAASACSPPARGPAPDPARGPASPRLPPILLSGAPQIRGAPLHRIDLGSSSSSTVAPAVGGAAGPDPEPAEARRAREGGSTPEWPESVDCETPPAIEELLDDIVEFMTDAGPRRIFEEAFARACPAALAAWEACWREWRDRSRAENWGDRGSGPLVYRQFLPVPVDIDLAAAGAEDLKGCFAAGSARAWLRLLGVAWACVRASQVAADLTKLRIAPPRVPLRAIFADAAGAAAAVAAAASIVNSNSCASTFSRALAAAELDTLPVLADLAGGLGALDAAKVPGVAERRAADASPGLEALVRAHLRVPARGGAIAAKDRDTVYQTKIRLCALLHRLGDAAAAGRAPPRGLDRILCAIYEDADADADASNPQDRLDLAFLLEIVPSGVPVSFRDRPAEDSGGEDSGAAGSGGAPDAKAEICYDAAFSAVRTVVSAVRRLPRAGEECLGVVLSAVRHLADLGAGAAAQSWGVRLDEGLAPRRASLLEALIDEVMLLPAPLAARALVADEAAAAAWPGEDAALGRWRSLVARAGKHSAESSHAGCPLSAEAVGALFLRGVVAWSDCGASFAELGEYHRALGAPRLTAAELLLPARLLGRSVRDITVAANLALVGDVGASDGADGVAPTPVMPYKCAHRVAGARIGVPRWSADVRAYADAAHHLDSQRRELAAATRR